MTAPFEGGCHCGAIRYRATAEPAGAAHCHCRDCQKTVGSAFTTFVFIPRDGIAITGQAKSYTVTSESGGKVTRSFCGECGSPVFSEVTSMPEMVFVKAGSLDDPSWVQPGMQFWTDRQQAWGKIPTEIMSFPQNPPQS